MLLKRVFGMVFTTWSEDVPMHRVARDACRQGYAVIPVRSGGKNPLCTLNARELNAAGPDHPCGVHHFILDPKLAERVFRRLGEVNLGIVAHPSRVIVVDADTPEQVESFLEVLRMHVADAATLSPLPTVSTPGARGPSGDMRHSHGGHWYFNVPEGLDPPLPQYPGSMTLAGGASMRWGMSMTVAPPSKRSEGPYVTFAEDLDDIPPGLLGVIREHVERQIQHAVDLSERWANDPVVAWSVSTPWSALLEPDGWSDTGKVDRTCGCPVFEKPGGGTSTTRSAIAHGNDCTHPSFLHAEGHGALHLFTDDPPPALAGRRNVTKLQYVALTHYAGDEIAAKVALGIAPDYSSMWESADGTDDPADVSDVSDADGADDPLGSKTASGRQQASDQEVPDPDEEAPDGSDVSGSAPDDVWTATTHRHLHRLGLNTAKDAVDRRVKSSQDTGGKVLDLEIFRDVQAQLLNAQARPRTDEEFVDEWLRAEVDSEPTHLRRSDGKFILTAGRVNLGIGRRGCGKTWLALHLALEALDNGQSVAYVDLEDSAGNMRGRFATMGRIVDDKVRSGQFRRFGKSDTPPDLRSPDVLADFVERLSGFDVVIFDVLSRLLLRMNADLNVCNTEVAQLYEYLFDPLAFGHGRLVLVLAHPNSAGQKVGADARNIEPAGGATTMNSLSGMGLSLDTVHPFTKENPNGEVRLWCRKDRSGYGEGDELGTLRGRVEFGDDTSAVSMAMQLTAPDGKSDDDRHAEVLEAVKRRILVLLQKRTMKRGDLQALITPAHRSAFPQAVAHLLHEGAAIETTNGLELPTEERNTP